MTYPEVTKALIEDLKYSVWVLRDENGNVHYFGKDNFTEKVTPKVGKRVVIKNFEHVWKAIEECKT